jgi:hypothetical protein
MEELRACLAANLLSDGRRSGWINAGHAHVEYVSPSGGLHEKRPNNGGGRIDDGRWTTRIGHCNFAILANASQSMGERRFIQTERTV